jgi:prolyl oligopeptidase
MRFLLHSFPLCEPPREVTRLSGTGFGARIFAHGIEAVTDLSAPLGRIVRIDPADPRVDCWTTAIAEMAESILSWEHLGDSWVIHYSAGSRLLTRVFAASGELIRIIQYPESGTTTLGHVDGHAHRLFYAHSDISDPPTIWFVDFCTGEHQIWWRQRSPSQLPTLDIEERTYPSLDGIPIPITLIRPRGVDQVRPVLLSAYGAAGVSATSKFSVLLTILAECGFTCAIAHVRGGGEGGLNWHHAARKQRKQLSVDDLVGAAEWLVKHQYTTSDLLGIAGQSAGGLLVLCAITQKPHLFRAALALGPLADLTRFHLFGVARGFVGELGSPDDPEEFRALFRMSPYHHVRQGAEYPAVLIISGDRDKRCDSLHARKMIARLKSLALRSHPILLDYSELRGHKPVLPLTERIRALTDRLTFLVAELGRDTLEVQHL